MNKLKYTATLVLRKIKRIGLLCLMILAVASCGNDVVEPEPEISEGDNFITGFSSVTNGKEISFSWDYLYSNFGHLDVKITKTDGTPVSSFTLTDKLEKTYTLKGEADTIYAFTFTPYTRKEVKCREVKGSRIVHEAVSESGLPQLIIETKDWVWPTCDFVIAPEGCLGRSITNNENVACSVRLENNTGDVLNKKSNWNAFNCKIRIRGNSSAWGEKSPYKIKLEKKEDLVGLITKERDDSKYEDKNWLLLNCEHPMNNVIGFAATEYLGIDFVPAYAYVEVYINGDYRGIYLLVENVKEGNTNALGEQSRCAVSVDGYIMENDAYWWNEDFYIETSQKRKITFKYPDTDSFEELQLNYIKNYLNDAELALMQKDDSFLDYFDAQSFAEWAMIHEYLGCADPAGSNQFFMKKDSTDNSKLEVTTAWDFDGIMEETQIDKLSLMHVYDNFFTFRLLKKDTFLNLCKEVYANTKEGIIDFIDAKIDALDSTAINKALMYNQWRWGFKVTTVAESREKINTWLSGRFEYLDATYGLDATY